MMTEHFIPSKIYLDDRDGSDRDGVLKTDLETPARHRVISEEKAIELAINSHETHVLAMTSGSFDILHVGHFGYLEALQFLGLQYARFLQRPLSVIVGINSDESTRRNKEDRSNGRPIFPEYDRARAIASLRSIDYVFIFDRDEDLALLNPHLFQVFAYSDHKTDERPEIKRMKAQGTHIIEVELVVPRTYSTSDILRRIHEQNIR